MNININVKRNVFNDAYYPYLKAYKHRFEVYYGGAGSGKSHFLAQKIFLKCLYSKRKVLVIRKVSKTLKDSVFQLFLDMISQFKLYSLCRINLSTYTITLPNGSMLLFKGLDDSEKIKSIVGITDIWIEEATEITMDEFAQLDLRLRAEADNLQMYLSFNPVSKANWVYKYFFDSEQLNTFILKTTYKDNKFLPQEYINTLENMKLSNPTYYSIYALGDFCSLDKLVYNNWSIAEFDYKDITGKLLIGLDFGFTNDPTALICSVLEEETNTLYIFDEHVETGLTNDKIARIIINKGYSKSIIIADSAEQKSVEEIKKCGIYRIASSVKGQGSVLQGIQKLQQLKIVVHSQCQQTTTELQNYSWKKDKATNEYINEPIDKFNHCLDALRYSLQCISNNKLKTLDKSLLGL